MKSVLRQLRDLFTSLQLTVVLLVLSLILVFVGTLDQVNLGIWAVQQKYFQSFLVWWPLPGGSRIAIPVFPGGYLIGGLLLINLICAHIYRFELSWRKLGIQLAHAGIIILLIGELLTGLWQQESFMRLDEGQTKSYSESFSRNELVLIDTTNPAFDEVVAIPESRLAAGGTLQHPKLPFQVHIERYHANAALQMRGAGSSAPPSPATSGIGPRVLMTPLALTYKPNERNVPSAVVEFVGAEGTLGTWLASSLIETPQTFDYQGRSWRLALRSTRLHKPFAITLLDFTHDKYPGTEIPKNFSSHVRVKSDDGQTDREVLIFMNNPLRFGGFTFYQSGFDNNDRTSILQVVRNPSWLLPYIACVLMGLGLTVQFGMHLFGFIRKRQAAAVQNMNAENAP